MSWYYILVESLEQNLIKYCLWCFSAVGSSEMSTAKKETSIRMHGEPVLSSALDKGLCCFAEPVMVTWGAQSRDNGALSAALLSAVISVSVTAAATVVSVSVSILRTQWAPHPSSELGHLQRSGRQWGSCCCWEFVGAVGGRSPFWFREIKIWETLIWVG